MSDQFLRGAAVGKAVGYATVYGMIQRMVAENPNLTSDEISVNVLEAYEKQSKSLHRATEELRKTRKKKEYVHG